MTNDVLHAFAHDLRHHVRTALTRSQLIQRSPAAECLTERELNFLAEAITSMGEVDALLKAFMRYADSLLPPPITNPPVALDLVVRGVLIEMRPKFEQASGSVSADPIVPQERVPTSARFILKELLENALKFRRDAPPAVNVRFGLNGHVSFSVEDNGIGVESSIAQEIFTPFRRIHARTEYPGFGLGLATCRGLLQRCEGSLEFSPNPHGGSIFTCRFPKCIEP